MRKQIVKAYTYTHTYMCVYMCMYVYAYVINNKDLHSNADAGL